MLNRRTLTLLALLLCAACPRVLHAQRFGGNPPSLKWRQIVTDTVRVIYPEGLDSQAQRVAQVTHFMSQGTAYSIGTRLRRINIVLQSQTTVANGYVGLAPWRSEFFLTPVQNSLSLGSLPWIDQLATHEYRHVQQYTNFREGPAKIAWYALGEQGQALLNSMVVPDWFFEGDAVYQETAVTQQGRGRLPDFFNGYRSLWAQQKSYSYQKLRNGSLLHFVPNHYELGYLLVTHGRSTYGPTFWKSVTSDAVRLKPMFYPMQGAIRKQTGKSFSTFVDDAFAQFRDDSLRLQPQPGKAITPAHKRYVTDYQFPVAIGADSILALRQSYRQIPAWVVLSGGRETRIQVRDISLDAFHSYRDGQLVYTRWQPQVRWGWKDFSDIMFYDLHTGTRRQLTRHSRYFSPDLSPDKSRVVAVHVDGGGTSQLHVLDASSGNILRKLPNPGSYFYTYPVFNRDGSAVFTAVRNGTGQMAMVKIDLRTDSARIIIPFSNRPMAFLRVRGDVLLFSASYARKDAVWAWDDAAHTLRELAGGYTGAYMADLDTSSRKLLWSGFTADGMRLYTQDLDSGQVTDLAQWSATPAMMYAEAALAQEKERLLYVADTSARGSDVPGINEIFAPAIASRHFPSSHYRSSARLFNFHSWRPWYEQPDWTLTAYSENVLNTLRSELYYNYNQNEGYHRIGFSGVYGGWYPWITGGLSYTLDRFFADGPLGSTQTRVLNWDEFNANLGVRIPFNFSGGRHYRFLSVAAALNTQQLFFKETQSGKPANQDYRYLQFNMSWSMQNQQARQHIFPRFAHSIVVQSRSGIGNLDAWQASVNANLYLPGFHVNHNLVLGFAAQARDTLAQYVFTNNFALARGYPGLDYPRMGRVSANYHFPIWYPDIGAGNVIYLLRLRANTWYDASVVKSLRLNQSTWLRSTGVELFFDTRLWNQQPVSFGIRYSRLLDADAFAQPPSKNQWEFILPLNLIPN